MKITGYVSPGQAGGGASLQEATVKSNASANQTIEPGEGYDGFSEITVEKIDLQNKTVTLSNQQQVISADQNYDALGNVTVPAVSLQNKSVTPTDSQQVISCDGGYDGLGTVTVGAASNLIDYVVDVDADSPLTVPSSFFRDQTILKSFSGPAYSSYHMVNLGEQCFRGCSNLEYVKIPNGMTIATRAFEDCNKLTDLYVGYNNGLPMAISLADWNTVRYIAHIHVPADSLSAYQSDSVWGNSNIVGKLVGDYVP